ncbi:uncharacterized protein LOC120432016 [Culex pipiens pallens]|uniref:uncharacterized protein LOC120432016 n=1 Tax=Culex pipiens pallens TaxID=42434 RepID=UPI001953FDFB|nr:uncharacterized protein LOC120432016 [Culex pipiens pallens]
MQPSPHSQPPSQRQHHSRWRCDSQQQHPEFHTHNSHKPQPPLQLHLQRQQQHVSHQRPASSNDKPNPSGTTSHPPLSPLRQSYRPLPHLSQRVPNQAQPHTHRHTNYQFHMDKSANVSVHPVSQPTIIPAAAVQPGTTMPAITAPVQHTRPPPTSPTLHSCHRTHIRSPPTHANRQQPPADPTPPVTQSSRPPPRLLHRSITQATQHPTTPWPVAAQRSQVTGFLKKSPISSSQSTSYTSTSHQFIRQQPPRPSHIQVSTPRHFQSSITASSNPGIQHSAKQTARSTTTQSAAADPNTQSPSQHHSPPTQEHELAPAAPPAAAQSQAHIS